MSKTDETRWLRKRLDAIIQLLLENGDGAAKSVTDKVERLLAMGFTHTETAEVIGKKPNYVWAVVGQKEKRRGVTKRGRGKKQTATPEAPSGAAPESST